MRTRKVWCETVPEGIVIADSMCDCEDKPAENEVCTSIPGLDECYLLPLWKVGEFSEVSARFSKGRSMNHKVDIVNLTKVAFAKHTYRVSSVNSVSGQIYFLAFYAPESLIPAMNVVCTVPHFSYASSVSHVVLYLIQAYHFPVF